MLRTTQYFCLAALCLNLSAASQTNAPTSSQKPKPPKVEVPRETETGESDADKKEEQKEPEAQPDRGAAQAQPANPAPMPEYPTEIVATVKDIKPFPIEKVRLNEDVPSSSVFHEVRLAIHKALPVAGNRDVVVEPGAEVALITRDPITQQWVGKKITGLVRMQGDTRVHQRFLSNSKLTSQKSGSEHSK
jgi:hypothetical protein